MLRSGRQPNRDHSDWRQEHEQKRRGALVQCAEQDVALSALDELAARLPQIVLLPEQDLRDWRRLRHVVRSVRHPRKQVELHLLLQLAPRQLALLLLLIYRHHGWSRAVSGPMRHRPT